ncbi:MAG: D-lyxose/D-mannose family sugar isomerase [Bacteroidales bacterium]
MKRSEINRLIKDAKDFFDSMHFKLPPWGYWPPEKWKHRGDTCKEITENQLGWDLTDFGSGDFASTGLLLFTLRNGNLHRDKKPYAEKIMIVGEQQVTPMHFHWSKMEDIINRGGGNLVIELYPSDKSEGFAGHDFEVSVDGIRKQLSPGDTVTLSPGESITLYQRLYHKFYGEKGKGKVLVGEVSTVNDDHTDNRFYKPVGRFPGIDEDEPPVHLLVGDYAKYCSR